MKVVPTVVSLLSMSNLGRSAPVANSVSLSTPLENNGIDEAHALALRSPNELDEVLAHLENRANTCRSIGTVIKTIATSTATLAWLNLGSHLAQSICDHYNDPDCTFWVKTVNRALNGVFAIAAAKRFVDTSGAVGANNNLQLDSTDARSLPDTSYGHSIGKIFYDAGIEHDTVENVDIQALKHQKRSTDEPDLIHRAIVRGIKNNGFVHDIAFNHYSNNETNLHLGGPNQTLSADPSEVHKRTKQFPSPGLKVSFTTRKASKLSKADQDSMSHAIGLSWQACAPHTTDFDGLVKESHKANFYFRIIPEVRSFGLNYESVDKCGTMARFL